ncbi:MAG TPA: ATP-binding protein [Candidatus Eisenbacteria bacterium]|nr:ATP-binding protein [Candidatus Eisenbacteria bacterium]
MYALDVRSLTRKPFTRLALAFVAAALVTAWLMPGALRAGLAAAIALPLVLFGAALLVGYVSFRSLDQRFATVAESAEAQAGGDLATLAPVDEHDEVGQLARALNDLAARHNARVLELRAERDAGESILGHLPLGLALLETDLRIRHANTLFWEMMGLTPPPGEVRLFAARQPALEQIALDALRRGRGLVRDVTLYRGGRREYEARVTPVGAEGSTPESLLLSVEDLGPEKAMAALRREFVANASHELRTPLTSIRGYAETLLGGALDDESHRVRFVETIRDQASRLESLVVDLLELADLERPDAPLELKDWDLGEVARDLGATFTDLAARRGLDVLVDARPGVHARVDRKRLELALRNLLDNAVKYTEAGSITLRVEPVGRDLVRVLVIDTGRGVSAEHLPRLFERFYRVDRGRSRDQGGTGLGLSIVKHVIQLHGGKLGVESKPGEGSTFSFEIPVAGPGGPMPAGDAGAA